MSNAGTRRHLSATIFAGVTLAILVTSTLSGCAPEQQGSPSSTPAKPSTTSQKPTKSPLATASASAVPFALKSEPTDKTCESILSLQSLYDFDPNLALTPGGTPASGSLAQSQTQLGGITCTLTNLSSQQEVLVTMVKLDQASADHQKAEIATATGNNSYQVAKDVPGSFQDAGGIGTAQFVSGKYWISLTSSSFKIGVEASPLSYVIWNNLQ